MAVSTNPFDSWLNMKLQSFNTDEGVFGSYIRGILEGDETHDEKTEALESILAGITDEDISKHVAEILETWTKYLPEENLSGSALSPEDVDVHLARMLESQCLPTTSQKSYTEEERRIREAILAQYSQMTDEEVSEDEGSEDGAKSGENCIEKNTNLQEKEKRDKAKRAIEMEKDRMKKEKDKEDREKQKQIKEEKKEKRKTQKGERRR